MDTVHPKQPKSADPLPTHPTSPKPSPKSPSKAEQFSASPSGEDEDSQSEYIDEEEQELSANAVGKRKRSDNVLSDESDDEKVKICSTSRTHPIPIFMHSMLQAWCNRPILSLASLLLMVCFAFVRNLICDVCHGMFSRHHFSKYCELLARTSILFRCRLMGDLASLWTPALYRCKSSWFSRSCPQQQTLMNYSLSPLLAHWSSSPSVISQATG